MGVEAGAASELEDAGAADGSGEEGADLVAFEEGDGGFAIGVVRGLDGVVLGGHDGGCDRKRLQKYGIVSTTPTNV